MLSPGRVHHNFYVSVVDLSLLRYEIDEETLEDMAMEAAQFLCKKFVYKAAGSYCTVGSLTGITLYQVELQPTFSLYMWQEHCNWHSQPYGSCGK